MSADFGFACPAGGSWYACTSGSHFVGCCTSDPCSNGCVQGNIRPGAFNESQFGKFPDATCGRGSDFYTCKGESTFWGCCKTNACGITATCPSGDLVPALMDRPEQFNAYTSPSSSSTPSPPPEGKSSKGAIIGGAVGGAVVFALIIGVIIFLLCRRKKRKQKESKVEVEGGANATTPMIKSKGEHLRLSEQYNTQTPPPTYTSPNPNSFQSDFQANNHAQSQTYENYSHNAQAPSELPAEVIQYSELPAETSPTMAPHRVSELPAGATQRFSELESPQPSPRPLQSRFSQNITESTQAQQISGMSTAGQNK